MSVVFVLGAGASYGDSLEPLESLPHLPDSLTALRPRGAQPPLVTGFFGKSLYETIGYDARSAEADFKPVFDYARRTQAISDSVGEGKWEKLDLEDLFTSIEVQREFSVPESDESASLLLLRNNLTRYVQRILGTCRRDTFGKFSRLLVSSLTMEGSVITFNYDLLLDQEFYRREHSGNGEFEQYDNFENMVLHGNATGLSGPSGAEGLFLKLHGSLNWSRCTDIRCPRSSMLVIDHEVQPILDVRTGIGEKRCVSCDGVLVPLLIPPLLHKPITENPAIRAAWGLAQRRLAQASSVVVIGYSAPPTDFYTRWLLRSSVGSRNNVKIVVVNPANKANAEFDTRMNSIFLLGYEDRFTQLAELEQILDSVGLHPPDSQRRSLPNCPAPDSAP
jgi:hypothetical protein